MKTRDETRGMKPGTDEMFPMIPRHLQPILTDNLSILLPCATHRKNRRWPEPIGSLLNELAAWGIHQLVRTS